MDSIGDNAMLNALLDPQTQEPRSPGFWWAFGALAALLLATFWLVCNAQVERAEARRTESSLAQVALADCLQYIPGATIGSCTQRIAPAPGDGATQQVSFNAR
ncbi:hypothetical protein [Ramlibacter albus]|uniref:Uncharacterized protein n=1 Tax=Ramlibacter albus TaxID=2079448 RepID=A0A923M9K1_9BURK|nr:hypothetical protein [Ramlibacter albus]MBC5765269.1 hypothetical protein [Ramlibacter albus]